MLLFSREIQPNLRFAAWQITENEVWFSRDLALSDHEAMELARHQHPTRRLEWLAGRWLLHRLTDCEGDRYILGKDSFSKPFFIDYPDLYCSLSHSKGHVAALLSAAPCGCDIQVLVEKMPRLAPKFMRPEEFDFVRQHDVATQFLLLHVFWTAKEALYKHYGLKALDFRANIRLAPFEWEPTGCTMVGWIEKEDFQAQYNLTTGSFEPPHGERFIWTVV
jgi:4'-phosphopantetheinyl transferase